MASENIVVIAVHESEVKSDAMWHVPHGYEVVEEKINNWLDFPELISLNEFPLQLTHNYRTYNKCKDILRKLILHNN